MLLAELKEKGQKVEISRFAGELLYIERLKELGLYEGVQLEYIGQAPFRGPQLFLVGSTVLALRADEASCAEVKVL